MIRIPALALMAAGLAACQTTLPGPAAPPAVRGRAEAPPDAAPGTCWIRDSTPAVIETVTEQVMVQPTRTAEDGSITQPAVYRTETRQAIVQERHETWFETPCDAMMTPEFIASVQRALKARGLYAGPATGVMDRRTSAAIRAYQAPQGLDSGLLSMAAAQRLGLIAIDRDADG